MKGGEVAGGVWKQKTYCIPHIHPYLAVDLKPALPGRLWGGERIKVIDRWKGRETKALAREGGILNHPWWVVADGCSAVSTTKLTA